jgi:hypothetical protein
VHDYDGGYGRWSAMHCDYNGRAEGFLEGSDEAQIDAASYEKCVHSISERISQMVEDISFRQRLADEQYRYIKQHFLIDNKIKFLEELFE